MAATKKTICPRDCYANCGLLVTVEEGRAIGLRGDPDHPYNRGVICPKSRQFLDLVYSPSRVLAPLLRREDKYVALGWDDALNLLADKLSRAKSSCGPSSILHYSDAAHSGVLHNSVSRRFFRAFGGCTRPLGSLCMSAGVAALEAAFGSQESGDLTYLSQAGSIILWGANPAVTNVPLLPYLHKAKQAGARLYVIDPVRTLSAGLADDFTQPRPGSDVELALGLARCLLQSGSFDHNFVSRYSQDFHAFKQLVLSIDEKTVETATGLSWETIQLLASALSERGPVSAVLGFGLQRHANGAQVIWAITSLMALAGSLGIPGGGVYYAHSSWKTLGDISGEKEYSFYERTIQRGAAGSELLGLGSQIKVAVINQANPLVQNPAADLFARALQDIPFVVVLDQFLTPTAKAADLILPVTSFLENGDLIHNSWHHYLALSQPVIEPLGDSRSDPEIFLDLGGRLSLFNDTQTGLLQQVIAPLAPYGVTLTSLQESPWRYPAPAVPWEKRKFASASGKFQFWDGHTAGFEYTPTRPPGQEDYPYLLLTPQPAEGTHSQGLAAQAGGLPVFYVHPQLATDRGLRSGQEVVVQTARAEVGGLLQVDDRIHPAVVLSYNGLWPSTVNAGLNVLISETISTAGNQAAMYDCRCMVRGR